MSCANPLITSCPSIAGLGLICFSFLRRRGKKPKPSSDFKPSSEGEPGEPRAADSEEKNEPKEIGDLLSRARFPLRTRTQIIGALGGKNALVRLGDSSVLPAGEVADRCLSRASSFNSSDEVLGAFSHTSWVNVVMGSINMLPFPVESKSQLQDRLRGKSIEGVQIGDLLGRLDFPIESPSDLLSQLSEARFGALGRKKVRDGSVDPG